MKKVTAGLSSRWTALSRRPTSGTPPTPPTRWVRDGCGGHGDARCVRHDPARTEDLRQLCRGLAGAEAAGREDADFAKLLGDACKIVVSNQPWGFTWRNSMLLPGDLVEAATAVEERAGGHEHRHERLRLRRRPPAGGRAARRLHLLVRPIVVRKGMRLFDDAENALPLTLLSAKTFTTGVQYLVYGPAESSGEGTYDDTTARLAEAGA